jgi:hypothetical protein
MESKSKNQSFRDDVLLVLEYIIPGLLGLKNYLI